MPSTPAGQLIKRVLMVPPDNYTVEEVLTVLFFHDFIKSNYDFHFGDSVLQLDTPSENRWGIFYFFTKHIRSQKKNLTTKLIFEFKLPSFATRFMHMDITSCCRLTASKGAHSPSNTVSRVRELYSRRAINEGLFTFTFSGHECD